MNQDKTKKCYFLYARKSSESEEKQVQSIDDQVLIMQGIAKSYGLKVVDVITESKSAKEPYARVAFEKIIERIEAGEAQGILAWKIDRLSRNPIDSAKVHWLLQKEVIKSIRTPDREYLPEDNTLLLSVESSMSNQYIRDLSKNVKRGLKSKLDKGWMPGSAPLGYLNTKTEIRGENYIIKDPERFDLLRKAWDLMLTGNYVPFKILDILNNDWGFRTRGWKKRGGKPMSRSTIYRIFTNPFYCGVIPYKGANVEGKHPPMVDFEEFDRVQLLLGRKGKHRPNRHHEYAYTGTIKCGECGGFISATFKEKLIKKTGKVQEYTLYYCTKSRRSLDQCSQRRYTNAEKLEKMIEQELGTFTILPEFKDWALAILAEQNNKEIEDRSKIYEAQQKVLNETQKKIDNLTQMRISELLDDEEYLREKARLKNEHAGMKAKMTATETRAETWLELTEKTFEFACCARKAFLLGDAQTRKEILSAIGLNCTLKDHILKFEAVEWLVPIKEQRDSIASQMQTLEPEKILATDGRNEALASVSPLMRG